MDKELRKRRQSHVRPKQRVSFSIFRLTIDQRNELSSFRESSGLRDAQRPGREKDITRNSEKIRNKRASWLRKKSDLVRV